MSCDVPAIVFFEGNEFPLSWIGIQALREIEALEAREAAGDGFQGCPRGGGFFFFPWPVAFICCNEYLSVSMFGEKGNLTFFVDVFVYYNCFFLPMFGAEKNVSLLDMFCVKQQQQQIKLKI